MITIADKKGCSRNATKEAVKFELDRFIGSKVAVVYTTIPLCRDGFHTAVSAAGNLECKDDEFYRVVSDDGNYAYFTTQDIRGLAIKVTRNNERAVIYIS